MVTTDAAYDIVRDAKEHIYTLRPGVEWKAFRGGNHRCSGQFALDILELMPEFVARFPHVLAAHKIVCKRPALGDSVLDWLAQPYDLSHRVSYACWITSEFGPSTVHLVVFALACCRGICSDRVVILLSICVVAVA